MLDMAKDQSVVTPQKQSQKRKRKRQQQNELQQYQVKAKKKSALSKEELVKSQCLSQPTPTTQYAPESSSRHADLSQGSFSQASQLVNTQPERKSSTGCASISQSTQSATTQVPLQPPPALLHKQTPNVLSSQAHDSSQQKLPHTAPVSRPPSISPRQPTSTQPDAGPLAQICASAASSQAPAQPAKRPRLDLGEGPRPQQGALWRPQGPPHDAFSKHEQGSKVLPPLAPSTWYLPQLVKASLDGKQGAGGGSLGTSVGELKDVAPAQLPGRGNQQCVWQQAGDGGGVGAVNVTIEEKIKAAGGLKGRPGGDASQTAEGDGGEQASGAAQQHAARSSGVFRESNTQAQEKAARGQGAGQGAAHTGAEHAQKRGSGGKGRMKILYGNYPNYYGYRLGREFEEDPRLRVFKEEWFKGKRVLDVGCNSGVVTLALALKFNPAQTTGVDIDGSLIAKACRQLRELRKRSTTQLTQHHTLGPSARGTLSTLRHHVSALQHVRFLTQDWTSNSAHDAAYEAVLMLSVTKWMHLHVGDAGMKRLFRKVGRVLSPGGRFIVEPQEWSSYAAAVHKLKRAGGIAQPRLKAYSLMQGVLGKQHQKTLIDNAYSIASHAKRACDCRSILKIYQGCAGVEHCFKKEVFPKRDY